MILAGVTGFRVNTSHLSLLQLQRWLDRLEVFLASPVRRPALILDLQGSKWRLGNFRPFPLENGQALMLVCAAASEQTGTLPVPHPDFFVAASLSTGEIVLDDAKIQLAVESVGPDWLKAHVTRGGEISPKKGITFTSCAYRKETLSDRDQAILVETRGNPSIRYAISYIKSAAEMSRYRVLFGSQAALIAKLERREAVQEALQVAEAADELWLCRGDLGAELGMKAMAEGVHHFNGLFDQLHQTGSPGRAGARTHDESSKSYPLRNMLSLRRPGQWLPGHSPVR